MLPSSEGATREHAVGQHRCSESQPIGTLEFKTCDIKQFAHVHESAQDTEYFMEASGIANREQLP